MKIKKNEKQNEKKLTFPHCVRSITLSSKAPPSLTPATSHLESRCPPTTDNFFIPRSLKGGEQLVA